MAATRSPAAINSFVGGERATVETPLSAYGEVFILTSISGGQVQRRSNDTPPTSISSRTTQIVPAVRLPSVPDINGLGATFCHPVSGCPAQSELQTADT
jgi:hypothetical protein